jgi:ribosomal protein S18 acetylase RimI-like enzyme
VDLGVIREMLFYAARWRPSEEAEDRGAVLDDDKVARYVEGWGRPGDLGVIAEWDGRAVGAAWVRLFTSNRPGYGFVDRETPELSIAVVPEQRGAGIGSALLTALVRAIGEAGYRAVSLSVESDNPARRLYERFGFQTVAKAEGSWTMCRYLEDERSR